MYYLQLLDLLFFVKCLNNPSDSFNVFNHVTFHSGSTRSSSNPKNSEIRSNSLQRPKGSSPCMAVVRRFDCIYNIYSTLDIFTMIFLGCTLSKLITLVVIATDQTFQFSWVFTATFLSCVPCSTREQLLKYQLGVWVAPSYNQL